MDGKAGSEITFDANRTSGPSSSTKNVLKKGTVCDSMEARWTTIKTQTRVERFDQVPMHDSPKTPVSHLSFHGSPDATIVLTIINILGVSMELSMNSNRQINK